MTGLTVKDFTQSVAYREIFGQGRHEGRRDEAAAVTLRLLNRRCGPLNEATTAQILGLLDFQGPAELAAWMAGNA